MPTLIYSDFPRTEVAMMLTLFPNQIVFLKFLNYIRISLGRNISKLRIMTWSCNFNCVKALILHILPHLDDTIFNRGSQMRNLPSETKLHNLKTFSKFYC